MSPRDIAIRLREFRNLLTDVVFEGAELEGLGLTYAKTYEILHFSLSARKKYPQEQIEAVNGVLKAYEYIAEIIKDDKEIDILVFKKINELVDKYEESKPHWHPDDCVGKWRKTPKGIGGAKKYIPPILNGHQYAQIVENCIRKDINLHNEIINLARLSKTQAFPDGNKRSALIFCNAFLLKYNLPLIRIKNHETYARLIVGFYDDENKLDKFVKYVETNSLKLQQKADIKYHSNAK